ncbi:MAG: response regulator [Bacteroidales bacterium]|nr:response regulator [Bacteroidales bacterium]
MKNKLIFFVDDDKMMLDLMEYTFKCREGFEVKSFFSGEECMRNLHLNPNVIVLDYYLGEGESNAMSGLETLKKIHSLNNKMPVIILSREKDKRLINQFIQFGAKEYVIKDDFFIDTLIETIDDHFMENLD